MTSEEFKQEAQALRPQLISLAKWYLRGTDEAEDVVQDALLKLWQLHDELRSPMSAMAATITRNLCIDRLRRQHRTEPLGQMALEEEAAEDPRTEQVLSIIDALPTTQQTVLRLRHIEGMGMKDIAGVIGSTEVATRKTLSRARMAVRQQYQKILAITASLLLLVSAGAIWYHFEKQNECVAYIYGERTTDRDIVMREMQTAIASIANDEAEKTAEEQLKELFSE